MSGRTKRILYEVFETVLGLIALAGTVILAFVGAIRDENQLIGCTAAILVFGIFCVILPINVLIHECGHLLFGGIARLKFISVSVGWFRLTRGGISITRKRSFAGETQMLPKSPKGVRSRMACFAFGGAFLNLVYGIVFLTLFFILPMHPVLFFFEMCAPLNLYEGLVALIPIELEAGRTDGKLLADLIGNTPYAKIFLAVLSVQGLLYKQAYTEIPQELLFELPVIREDEPAFLALTQLRWQYLYMHGDDKGALAQVKRLEQLADYLTEEEKYAEVLCEAACGYGVLLSDGENAEKLIQASDAAKDTFAYVLAEYTFKDGKEEDVLSVIEKETAIGLKVFEKTLFSRVKDKKNSAAKQN